MRMKRNWLCCVIRYIRIMRRHELQISQPAVDGASSWPITVRQSWTGKEVHKRNPWEGLFDNCTKSKVTPPCAGSVFQFQYFMHSFQNFMDPCLHLFSINDEAVLTKSSTCLIQFCWNSSTSFCEQSLALCMASYSGLWGRRASARDLIQLQLIKKLGCLFIFPSRKMFSISFLHWAAYVGDDRMIWSWHGVWISSWKRA